MMKSKEFPELKAWLQKSQGKFVNQDVQNEILTIMSKSFSQKWIIHTVMHTPSLYPSKM